MQRLLIALVLFTTLGCAEEALQIAQPDIFDESDGELSARIDGRRFRANAAFALHDNTDSSDSLSTLQIIAGDIRNEEDGEAIVLALLLPENELPASATYGMDPDCDFVTIACLGGGYGQSLGDGEIEQTFVAEIGDPRAAASLTFTTYEDDGRPAIRGTFSMVLISDEDDSTIMEITDGEFDILLAEIN